jgi:hypothetical protein
MGNDFGAEVDWDAKTYEPIVIAKNIKNIHVCKLLNKLKSFFKWFADSQVVCK